MSEKSDSNNHDSNTIDLTDLLSFYPEIGRLQFSNNYVSLIHISALASLKREIIEKYDIKTASRLYCQLGFMTGQLEAETCLQTYPNHTTSEIFKAGQQARIVRGELNGKTERLEIDLTKPYFYEELTFTGNFEVDAILQSGGLSKNATCWMQVGYMSGFASTLLGQPVVYKETECEVSGFPCCRMIGQFLSDWQIDEITEHLNYLPFTEVGNPPSPSSSPQKNREKPQEKINIVSHYGIIGSSTALKQCIHRIENVAKSDTSVLFLGETGVGKERFAQTLHNISNRSENPFIAVNCSAIPDELVESELFGVKKGAYTDANRSRPGRFERANRGTLFLDEIGDLSWEAQTKLLRAIQEKEIERVGDSRTITIDVRIIAATSINLEEAVANGKFRSDLLYRINVFPVSIPPLRNRKSDIPMFLEHYINHFSQVHNKQIKGISSRTVTQLTHYPFEGNIRELENITERAIILAEEGDTLDYGHFPNLTIDVLGSKKTQENEADPSEELYDNITQEMLEKELNYQDIQNAFLNQMVEKNGGNISQTARELGITRIKLEYRLKKMSDS